eukprot:COSAG06_NODE_768_length_12452_cov_5.484537_7_plen_199_part_00
MTSLVLLWHIHLLLQLVHLVALGRLWKPDIVGRVVCGKEGRRAVAPAEGFRAFPGGARPAPPPPPPPKRGTERAGDASQFSPGDLEKIKSSLDFCRDVTSGGSSITSNRLAGLTQRCKMVGRSRYLWRSGGALRMNSTLYHALLNAEIDPYMPRQRAGQATSRLLPVLRSEVDRSAWEIRSATTTDRTSATMGRWRSH